MIELRLPEGATVRGVLEHVLQPEWLTQDVLEVTLPNGAVIDVGWYPEHNLEGSFWIRVFLEDWDHQLTDPILRRDPHDVKELVEQLAEHFHGNLISKSLSSNLVIPETMVV